MVDYNQQYLEELTKKERHFLRREERRENQFKQIKQKKHEKLLWIVIIVLLLVGAIWFLSTRPSNPEVTDLTIVAKRGIHWHSDLTIKILDKYQDIPADIGIGITHNPLHTHERDGVIHMEFSGLVKEENIRIGSFFKVWGKEFSKECILDKCNGEEGEVKMFVNQELNYQFENYIMQNNDKIEIIFE